MARPVTPSRLVAYDAFVKVMEGHQSPETALEQLYSRLEKPMGRLDRNLCKEILFGGLRWYGKIFWILQNTSSRDLKGVTAEIRAALVLGTYQIFYMEKIPDRAAVNESVEYVRSKGQAHAVNFVNGILRQIARRAEYFQKPDKVQQPVEYLSLQYSHPQWLVSRWFQHFNFERLQGMLASNNQAPPWFIRVNTLKVPLEEIHLFQQRLLREEKVASDRKQLRYTLELRDSPLLDKDSLFQQGYYSIQDMASQLISYLVDPKAGDNIVDAAAGKGGKLAHLFELSKGEARFWALDPRESQLKLARETMIRLGHQPSEEKSPTTDADSSTEQSAKNQIQWVIKDFCEWQPEAGAVPNKILIDAPCSAMGVLRRHPEGKWLKKEELIRNMASLQQKLIGHAFELLPVGGELIYSVCSFEPEETLFHVDHLKLKYQDRVELISPVSRLPDYFKRYVTRENLLVIYSGNQDSMDGFGGFIVRKTR